MVNTHTDILENGNFNLPLRIALFFGLKNQSQSATDVKTTAIEENGFTIGFKTDRNDNNRRRQIHSVRQEFGGFRVFSPWQFERPAYFVNRPRFRRLILRFERRRPFGVS